MYERRSSVVVELNLFFQMMVLLPTPAAVLHVAAAFLLCVLMYDIIIIMQCLSLYCEIELNCLAFG